MESETIPSDHFERVFTRDTVLLDDRFPRHFDAFAGMYANFSPWRRNSTRHETYKGIVGIIGIVGIDIVGIDIVGIGIVEIDFEYNTLNSICKACIYIGLGFT